MAAVDYASMSSGLSPFHMAHHDDLPFFFFDDQYSFDLSDGTQLIDHEGPKPHGLIFIPSRPPPPPPPPQGGVLQVATTATAGAAGQFIKTSQLATSTSNRSVEAAAGGGGFRVAFRTKTEVDVLDDGFKWRKYGKKSVKNSPNPRNYYRCSTEGCSVKKRVERDRDDPSYVITTYDGVHNHTSADVVYYATQDTASGHFVVSGRYGDTT